MTTEEWRAVPGAPQYDVSSLGRIRSRQIKAEGRLMIPSRNPSNGYLQVTLRIAGEKVSRPLHHWVALAFLGPRPAGLEVRHLDGTRTNNAAANLAYGTHAENMADKLEHGTLPSGRYLDREECVNGHPFTEANTYIQRRPRKLNGPALFPRCRQCDREQVAKRRADRRRELALARVLAERGAA